MHFRLYCTTIKPLVPGLTQMTLNVLKCILEITNKSCSFQEKRSLFPRFYFIGDDDLLEILGQSTNPQVIQTHLKKLFAGICSISCQFFQFLIRGNRPTTNIELHLHQIHNPFPAKLVILLIFLSKLNKQ